MTEIKTIRQGNQNTSLQTIHNEINTITHKQLDEVFVLLVNSVGITVIVVWVLKSHYQSLPLPFPPLLWRGVSVWLADNTSTHTWSWAKSSQGSCQWALQLIANLIQEFGQLFLSLVRFFWGTSLILRIHNKIKITN